MQKKVKNSIGKGLLAALGIVVCSLLAPPTALAAFDKPTPRAAEPTLGAYVGDFKLIDQDGVKFSMSDLKGKPVVVTFVYTGCEHTCPTLVKNIKTSFTANKALPGDKFTALTIGFDVPNDTPAKLKAAGARVTDDFKAWRFATGDKKTIEAMTKAFGFYYEKKGMDFIHTNMVSVLGPDMKIFRHIYSYDFKAKELLDPIYASILGTPGPKQVSIGLIDRIKLLCYTYDETTGTYVPDYFFLAFLASGLIINCAFAAIFTYLFFGRRIRQAIFKNANAH